MFRLRSCALALFCVLFCAGAARAQLILFEGPDFQGSKLTLRTAEPNLADSDFAGRAMSLIVQNGTWEICSEPNFAGDCQEVAPGPYEHLGRFARAIASIRAVSEGAASASSPQERYGSPQPPVVVVPSMPSACEVGRVEACAGCAVSCQPPQQAVCKPGSAYPKLSSQPVADCAFQAACSCR